MNQFRTNNSYSIAPRGLFLTFWWIWVEYGNGTYLMKETNNVRGT